MKYLILCLLLIGCGSRKVEVSKEEKKIEITTNELTTTIDTSNVEIKTDIETEVFTVEARDTTKEFIYNGKTYFNVVLKHEKKKDNSLYKKDIKVSKIERKQSNIKAKEVIKDKKVERKSNLYIYFIVAFFILVLIFWYLNRKYKGYVYNL